MRLPSIIPTPKRVCPGSGSLRLRDGLPIVLGPDSTDADFATARALRARLHEDLGLGLPIETHTHPDRVSPSLALRREGDAGEAYRIAVGEKGAELVGTGPAGLRWAVETLAQIVDSRGRIACCEIEDAPDLALRGIMLDVSRGKVPTLETLRTVVDNCARLKLNVLMLYVEHTFRFRRHPAIGAEASPLEAETLRELDTYAAECGVELIPSLQSLGHMDHVLNLPGYSHLAETPSNWTLAPSVPETYAFLGDLYDEFLPNFRSGLFNANCDETFDLGSGRSAKMQQELGPGGPFLSHVKRIRDLARGHGKRIMIWADMPHAHPERISEFDDDVVFLDWWYEAACDYDRVKRFAEDGRDFLVCPGTSSWNCLFPRVDNALENVQRWADAGKRHGALGLLITDWGDFGHYNLQGNSWLGYAWAAEQAWGGDGADFDRAFSRAIFGDASGTATRLYRELGAVHDAGFAVFNGSPLQFLFFDDLATGFFVQGARRGPLGRAERRLARVRERIEAARPRFRRETLTWQELLYAADASIFAVHKARSGGEYLAWRRRPARLDGRARRKLARHLRGLADEQRALGRRLQRLWLARSRSSNLALTLGRLRRSARSLAAAARALEKNRPPPPPPPHPGYGDVGAVLGAAWASLGD
ncbi:MAG: glycoside hydrolase family 20 zincin-like fold domain-containing protein [Myxococcota bacterium]|jgi:hypothetical protein|nr:glycoside hydrolase [Deltaproteobacteria bacterium]MCP4240730.1 family 20 glycosylhydrolase [bacterium]MDP6075036.1 glycoside hydrolase family 20 zincin-like fold domain-containing protein [Myxococcota bacterium]MDP6243315.1 glycoside hydrolase family 20 zincin-like fold domain-containing protein [Myxococcota bacterium]MDP7076205.1 glycoside hydrolase family 20 zincin-like fold domain-containing protein [Myxococcota bacterium]